MVHFFLEKNEFHTFKLKPGCRAWQCAGVGGGTGTAWRWATSPGYTPPRPGAQTSAGGHCLTFFLLENEFINACICRFGLWRHGSPVGVHYAGLLGGGALLGRLDGDQVSNYATRVKAPWHLGAPQPWPAWLVQHQQFGVCFNRSFVQSLVPLTVPLSRL